MDKCEYTPGAVPSFHQTGRRPLPDERPRQSVANLIGKFETQSKHLSPSQSNPSRSSSVVSHVTGDSAKDEIKERREWPPKPVQKIAPESSRFIDLDARKELAVQSDAEDLQQEARNEPNTFLENWRKDVPQSTDKELELATPNTPDKSPASAAHVQNVVSAAQTPRIPGMKTSTSKVLTSTSSRSIGTPPKAQGKSVLKPTPRQSLTPATSAQSLKPQLTGQSMVSSSSKRTISKLSITPRTPTRTETGTKTPTLTPRSKTPSSGLFAPTAASLARARNVPLPAPPPIKKTTISTDTMDRLSRPTAASLSRVKTGPSPTTSTPKSPPRMSSVKAKFSSPSKSPQTRVKKDSAVPHSSIESVVAPPVTEVDIPLARAEAILEQTSTEVTTNGHPARETSVVEGTAVSEVEQPEAPAVSDVVEVEINNGVYDLTNGAEVEQTVSKTNLEDIVTLLETISRPATQEISEIPDEE